MVETEQVVNPVEPAIFLNHAVDLVGNVWKVWKVSQAFEDQAYAGLSVLTIKEPISSMC